MGNIYSDTGDLRGLINWLETAQAVLWNSIGDIENVFNEECGAVVAELRNLYGGIESKYLMIVDMIRGINSLEREDGTEIDRCGYACWEDDGLFIVIEIDTEGMDKDAVEELSEVVEGIQVTVAEADTLFTIRIGLLS